MAPCPLLIVGAGGCGRETAEAVHAINRAHPTWDLVGFLDDDASREGAVVDAVPIVGATLALIDYPHASVVVTVGNPDNFTVRRAVVGRLGLPLERYATIVHPAAVIPPSVRVGPGTIILAGTVATAAVSIGCHVVVMPGVVFTHDNVVDDYATFGAGTRLAGGVHVCEGAYVGAGALIREKRTIGRWALVGMGAGVTRDIPPGEVWAGTPARFFRKVALPDDIITSIGAPVTGERPQWEVVQKESY